MGFFVFHKREGAPRDTRQVMLPIDWVLLLAVPPAPRVSHHRGEEAPVQDSLLPVPVGVLLGPDGVDLSQLHQWAGRNQVKAELAGVVLAAFS
jgi:hypothetical protein